MANNSLLITHFTSIATYTPCDSFEHTYKESGVLRSYECDDCYEAMIKLVYDYNCLIAAGFQPLQY